MKKEIVKYENRGYLSYTIFEKEKSVELKNYVAQVKSLFLSKKIFLELHDLKIVQLEDLQ